MNAANSTYACTVPITGKLTVPCGTGFPSRGTGHFSRGTGFPSRGTKKSSRGIDFLSRGMNFSRDENLIAWEGKASLGRQQYMQKFVYMYIKLEAVHDFTPKWEG